MQWMTLFNKEMTENWRNKKWIWVPLVFILLAITDPLSTYYMPQIIDAVGGLPEGTIIEMPEPAPAEVVAMSLGQFSSFGVLIIVLTSMGTIAGEIKNGVAELILVKPVAYKNYISAKWAAHLLLILVAFAVGMFASWYYINLLFGDLSFTSFLFILLFYGTWLLFVVTLSIFYNTFFKTPGLVAFFSILTIVVMSIVTQIFGTYLEWSPNNLSNYIFEMVRADDISSQLVGTSIVTVAISIVLLILSIYIFKTKELIQ
nr:ABC transporter permease subunit [Oceanobacillus bengalensis]